MNLYLIKLGKAIAAVQRDGIIVGGRRSLRYLTIFLKNVSSFKSGDILFITGGVGDSADYRSHRVAEELNLHGIKAEVTMQDNPFLPSLVNKFSVFIFHRTLFTSGVKKLVRNIKKQNKEIIFETDDLVFDTKYMHATGSYEKMSYFEKKQYAKGVGEEILKDEYIKICSTSTKYLANILAGYNKKVFIVKNKISDHDLEITEKILCNNKKLKDSFIRIGYFSGTMSHNRDFATIADALLEIMEKYPQTKLILAGPLEVENKLNKFKDRIEQSPFVPRDKHFENIFNVDINLAPLEIGDPYCESKSELKFFEAGIMRVPTVASATQTFCEAISDGVDGFVANGTTEWVKKLEKLITDKEFRINMGKLAYDKVMLKYTNKNSDNEEYYAYLRSKL